MRVDFYLLEENEPDDIWLTTCRLIEKIYLRNHRVFILCDNQKDAETLDELLWTFRDDSFIPHNLQGEGPEPPPPVQIGYNDKPQSHRDILINLSSSIPAFYNQFRRVLEVVGNDEKEKELSREHYRQYRIDRCQLHTHKLNKKEPAG